MRNYIFISYAHKDSERVLPVIKKLRESGYNVWYDDGIDPGTEWAVNIATHIEGCAYFLAFMSQAYLDSLNCREEWNFARDEQKTRFFVYIEDVTLPSEMRMRSSMIQNLFMHRYNDKEEFYSKLFAAPGIEVCKKAVPERETEKEETVADEAVSELERVEEQPEDEVVDEAVIEPECVGEQTEEVKTIEECEETTETVEEEDKDESEAEVVKSFRNLLYTDDGETVTIVGCKEGIKNLTIPYEIKGMPVVKIGARAFLGNISLLTIKISESVKEVEESAFRDCTSLSDIEGLCIACEIESDAFEGCVNLRKNPSLREEWEYSFEVYEFADKVTIRKCITDREEIMIPDQIHGKPVAEISYGAFKECTNLAKIDIPEGVTKIGECAFEGCTSLVEINISESVTEIGYNAFADCTKLTGVVIPKSVVEIGFAAFSGCSNLLSVVIPERVTVLSDYLFQYCEKLKRIVIPRNVKFIGRYTFSGCESLKQIKYSGENEFIPGDADAWNKLNIKEEQEKINQIPEGQMIILSDAFDDCPALVLEKLDDVVCEMIAIGGHEEAKARVCDIYLKYAHMYSYGDGVEQNEEKAIEYFRRVAIMGHKEAQRSVLDLYFEGKDVGLDKQRLSEMYCNVIEQESDWFLLQTSIESLRKKKQFVRSEDFDLWNREAAEKGNVYAQVGESHFWEKKSDLSKAIMWSKKAAEQGYFTAQDNLGRLYVNLGNLREASRWYEAALVRNEQLEQELLKKKVIVMKSSRVPYNIRVRHQLAELYVKINDWENAVRHYIVLAHNRDATAEYGLAMCYMTGRGVEQNYGKACELFQKAAEQGHAVSCLMLGMLYGTGKGVARNDEEAKRWYEKAGEKKN